MKFLQLTLLLLLSFGLSSQSGSASLSNEISLDDDIIYSGIVKEAGSDLPIDYVKVQTISSSEQ